MAHLTHTSPFYSVEFTFAISAASLDTSPSHIIMLFSIIFTTVFPTINHIYSTFALPMVSKVAASNATLTQPAKRDGWAPQDQKCTTAAQWLSRICQPDIGDRVWVDHCTGPQGGEAICYVYSSCPERTMCSNVIRNYKSTIVCIGRPSIDTVSQTGQQTGVFSVANTFDLNEEYIESVTLVTSISLASVSAFLEGKY